MHLPRRFSLRLLFISVTFIAVLLGACRGSGWSHAVFLLSPPDYEMVQLDWTTTVEHQKSGLIDFDCTVTLTGRKPFDLITHVWTDPPPDGILGCGLESRITQSNNVIARAESQLMGAYYSAQFHAKFAGGEMVIDGWQKDLATSAQIKVLRPAGIVTERLRGETGSVTMSNCRTNLLALEHLRANGESGCDVISIRTVSK